MNSNNVEYLTPKKEDTPEEDCPPTTTSSLIK